MNSVMKLTAQRFERFIPLLVMIFCFPLQSQSQELMPADTLQGWDVSWTASLNGSQAAYSNWSRGGSNTFSVVGSSQFSALFRENAFSYGLRIRTHYGQSRIEDEGARKTDDRLSLRNRFLYDLGDDSVDFSLFTNINFDSQFGRGFDYGGGPEGEDILISNFMSPAYFTQNAGLAYVPSDAFSVEAGLGMKQTIVSDPDLAPLYGLDPGESLFNEAGFTIGVNYEQEVLQNVTYTGSLETFTNLNRAVNRTDVILSHMLVGRINSYLNMTLQFDMIYDDDFSDQLQFSQVLSAGLSVRLY